MTLAQVTQASLDRMSRAVAAVLLVVAAAWFAVLPPEAAHSTGQLAALACIAGAAAVWWLGGLGRPVLRGPVSPLIAPAVVVVLGIAQYRQGMEGWWPQTATAAIGALIAVATGLPVPMSVLSAVVVLVGAGFPSVAMAATVATSPGLTLYRTLQLVLVYVIALAVTVTLRTAARRLDRTHEQAWLAQEQRIRNESDAVAAASIRRVVHDTLLNTLEAVANGVAANRWAQLVRRCTDDLRALQHLGDVVGSHRMDDVAASVQHLGLVVEVDDQWLSDPPELVSEALVGATREALLNAAKHSGATRATLRTRVEADSAWVEVTDIGVGFQESSAPRIGLQTAVMQALRDVGGLAIVDSTAGRGTRVSLTWDAARSSSLAVLSALRRQMLRFTGALAALSLGFWAALTSLDPGLAGRGARVWSLVVAAVVCALVLVGSYRRPPPTPLIMSALAGLTLVTLLLPLGDPYCASFQGHSALDPRLIILLCLAVAATSWRPFAASATVLCIASLAATILLNRLTAGCGWDFLMTAFVVCGVGLAASWFAQTLQGQRVLLDTQARARQDAYSLAAQELARTRGVQLWTSAELSDAADLLREIVTGAPDTEALRAQARDKAFRLRQWLLLVSTTGPVTAVLADAVRGSRVVLKGDPASVDQDCPEATAAARRLRQWLPRDPAAHVEVTVSRTGTTASVLATSDRRTGGEDPSAWTDEDGWWLHLTWPVEGGPEPEVGTQ